MTMVDPKDDEIGDWDDEVDNDFNAYPDEDPYEEERESGQ